MVGVPIVFSPAGAFGVRTGMVHPAINPEATGPAMEFADPAAFLVPMLTT